MNRRPRLHPALRMRMHSLLLVSGKLFRKLELILILRYRQEDSVIHGNRTRKQSCSVVVCNSHIRACAADGWIGNLSGDAVCISRLRGNARGFRSAAGRCANACVAHKDLPNAVVRLSGGCFCRRRFHGQERNESTGRADGRQQVIRRAQKPAGVHRNQLRLRFAVGRGAMASVAQKNLFAAWRLRHKIRRRGTEGDVTPIGTDGRIMAIRISFHIFLRHRE